MPQYNVHWKGRPHYYLPRIRIASLQYASADARRNAHLASLEVSHLPYSLALEKARLQQRTKTRRRKHISGRSPEIIVKSRATPVPDILPSGLESHLGEQEVSIWSSPKPNGRDNLMPSQFPAEVIDLKHPMQIRTQMRRASRQTRARRDQPVSTHMSRKNSIFRRASLFDRSRTYDPRLPIKGAHHRTKSASSKYHTKSQLQNIKISVKPVLRDKLPTPTDHPTRQAAVGYVSPVSTASSPQLAKLPKLPSRTPTELRALERFSRGLQRHLIAEEAVRKACLSLSSPSSSTLSADTVVDFIPYVAEFQAAGLAVTSIQQRRPALRQSEIGVVPQPPKRLGDREPSLVNVIEETGSESPATSHGNCSGTLRPGTSSPHPAALPSSDRSKLKRAVVPPARETSTKKVLLPWLRNAKEPSPTAELKPPESLTTGNSSSLSSESICDTCVSTVIDFSTQPVELDRKRDQPNPSPIGLQPLDTKAINTNNGSLKRENQGIAWPIIPNRTVRARAGSPNDGTKCGDISGNKSVPSALSSQMDHRLQTAIAKVPGSREKEKPKADRDLVAHSSERAIPIELTQASRKSPRSLRTSPKHLEHKRSAHAENLSPMDFREDVAVPKYRSNTDVPPNPSSHPSSSNFSQNRSLTPQLPHQSPDPPIHDQPGFPAVSVSELAPPEIANLPQEQFETKAIFATDLFPSSSEYPKSADPVKRKSAPHKTTKLSLQASFAATTSSLGFAATSETPTTTSTDHSDLRDKDVFKGLQIAIAAACNKDLDLRITNSSGYRVRQFLADLRAFEGLGVNALAGQAKRTAKRRMEERDEKTKGHRHGHVESHAMSGVVQERVRVQRGKKTPRLIGADDGAQRGLLLAQMLGSRDARASESVKERAIAMGWRGRSVSAG